MASKQAFVVVLLTVVLVTSSGAVAAGFTTPPQSQERQQAGGQCDYTDLYDESVDAVVSVLQARGQGSGFVYEASPNGSTSYVVTNAHVVGNASSVTIQFSRGESVEGDVRGTELFNDLAVVEVKETPDYVEALPVSASQPEHGHGVAALGSPVGLDESITHGIVSGLDRSLPTQMGFQIPNVVQTDAPISPGNSGGPLVACDGAVVGVNTAGIAAQGVENIGFAVSSTTVERVVPSLIETGEFASPTLGVSATGVTPTIAEANDLDETRGVIVATVNEEAPAADVLRESDRVERVDGEFVPIGGDVVLAVDGRNLSTSEDLASVLFEETRPGDEVTLTILRNGERTNVTSTVTDRPEPVRGAGQADS